MEQARQFVATDTEGLGSTIKIEAVPRLVLHLGEQDRLPLQCRCAGDPVSFRKLSDDLGMRVLSDLADQRLAVAIGHPILWLDLLSAIDALLKSALLRGYLLRLFHALGGNELGIHLTIPP